MSLHLASKYFASTKAASHTTQLTSPTSFWHNVKDLPQLLISNFLTKIPSSIFTSALTSNSNNWTSHNYCMDHHRLRESSHGAHTQNFYQSCTISLFVCEIPLHTHTHTHTAATTTTDHLVAICALYSGKVLVITDYYLVLVITKRYCINLWW